MKKNTGLYVIIGVLAVSQVYSVLRINSLEDKLQSIDMNLANIDERVGNRIDNIYNDVNNRMNDFTSIVSGSYYTVGDFDADNMTLPITFTVQPKALTDSTKVSLKIENELFPLERSGSEFVGTKNFNIGEENEPIFPQIVIEENGVQQFEDDANISIYSLTDYIIKELNPHFSGSSVSSGNSPYYYKLDGIINLGVAQSAIAPYAPNYANSNDEVYFENIRLVFTADDEVIKEFDDINKTDMFTLKEKFVLEKGQTLKGIVYADDSNGFKHEYLILHWVAGEDAQREVQNKNMKITAPNGKVIVDYNI